MGLLKETAGPAAVTILWFSVGAIAVSGIGLGIYRFVAPARVAIDNRVFHSSQAYTDGMARDLDNLRLAYMSADQAGRETIRATIQHRFAGYDGSTLPPDLRSFLVAVRQ